MDTLLKLIFGTISPVKLIIYAVIAVMIVLTLIKKAWKLFKLVVILGVVYYLLTRLNII